jgi:hypothetical protein
MLDHPLQVPDRGARQAVIAAGIGQKPQVFFIGRHGGLPHLHHSIPRHQVSPRKMR